ncbi:MAG: tetratricopeptide repeat protein [Bradyrhizobium sp.]
MRAERYLDAQICCQQALAIDSSHADSLHLMGLLSFQAQQYDHAVEWIARAIRQNPRPEYLVSLGMTLRSQGRHQDALNTINKAVELRPDDTPNCGDISAMPC